MFDSCRTRDLPYISDRGPSNKGPNPYPTTNIEVDIAIRTLLVIPNSSASWAVAGAIIDEDTGLINVNAETIAVAAHLD